MDMKLLGALFDHIDTDESGDLSQDEILEAVEWAVRKVEDMWEIDNTEYDWWAEDGEADVIEMIKSHSTDGEGESLGPEEALSLGAQMLEEWFYPEEIASLAVAIIDSDESGTICADEAEAVLDVLDAPEWMRDDVAELFTEQEEYDNDVAAQFIGEELVSLWDDMEEDDYWSDDEYWTDGDDYGMDTQEYYWDDQS